MSLFCFCCCCRIVPNFISFEFMQFLLVIQVFQLEKSLLLSLTLFSLFCKAISNFFIFDFLSHKQSKINIIQISLQQFSHSYFTSNNSRFLKYILYSHFYYLFFYSIKFLLNLFVDTAVCNKYSRRLLAFQHISTIIGARGQLKIDKFQQYPDKVVNKNSSITSIADSLPESLHINALILNSLILNLCSITNILSLFQPRPNKDNIFIELLKFKQIVKILILQQIITCILNLMGYFLLLVIFSLFQCFAVAAIFPTCLRYQTNGLKCQECRPGFTLSSGDCIPCAEPCPSSTFEPKVINNLENCKQIDKNGKCIICFHGYSIDILSNCKKIDDSNMKQNCLIYLQQTNSCFLCQDGYQKDTNGPCRIAKIQISSNNIVGLSINAESTLAKADKISTLVSNLTQQNNKLKVSNDSTFSQSSIPQTQIIPVKKNLPINKNAKIILTRGQNNQTTVSLNFCEEFYPSQNPLQIKACKKCFNGYIWNSLSNSCVSIGDSLDFDSAKKASLGPNKESKNNSQINLNSSRVQSIFNGDNEATKNQSSPNTNVPAEKNEKNMSNTTINKTDISETNQNRANNSTLLNVTSSLTPQQVNESSKSTIIEKISPIPSTPSIPSIPSVSSIPSIPSIPPTPSMPLYNTSVITLSLQKNNNDSTDANATISSKNNTNFSSTQDVNTSSLNNVTVTRIANTSNGTNSSTQTAATVDTQSSLNNLTNPSIKTINESIKTISTESKPLYVLKIAATSTFSPNPINYCVRYRVTTNQCVQCDSKTVLYLNRCLTSFEMISVKSGASTYGVNLFQSKPKTL